MGTWVAVLVVTSVLLDAPGRVPQKPAAGPSKKTTASRKLERAARPERDRPVLNLFWLLTTSSRR